MIKKGFIGLAVLLVFCLIFTFGTGYAKAEKDDDKGRETEKVEKIKKSSDDVSDDEKGERDKKTGKKDDDDDDDEGRDKEGKVTICHYPSGDKEKGQTISVSSKAAEKHIKEHGDTYGPCSGESEVEKKLKSWWEFWK